MVKMECTVKGELFKTEENGASLYSNEGDIKERKPLRIQGER